MWKALVLLFTFLSGAAVGGAVVLFYFPFWFPPAEVNEQIRDIESKAKLARGDFIHPDPSDSVHWGKGRVELYGSANGLEVFLAPDFEVGPGPDYHIYLVDALDITEEDHFTAAPSLELGKLKSFTGSQVYATAGDPRLKARSVVVWCKRFGQLITSAELGPP